MFLDDSRMQMVRQPAQVPGKLSQFQAGALDQAARLRGKRVVTLVRSEEHTSELQSPCNLVCRLLLEQKKRLSRNEILRSGSSVRTLRFDEPCTRPGTSACPLLSQSCRPTPARPSAGQ